MAAEAANSRCSEKCRPAQEEGYNTGQGHVSRPRPRTMQEAARAAQAPRAKNGKHRIRPTGDCGMSRGRSGQQHRMPLRDTESTQWHGEATSSVLSERACACVRGSAVRGQGPSLAAKTTGCARAGERDVHAVSGYPICSWDRRLPLSRQGQMCFDSRGSWPSPS